MDRDRGPLRGPASNGARLGALQFDPASDEFRVDTGLPHVHAGGIMESHWHLFDLINYEVRRRSKPSSGVQVPRIIWLSLNREFEVHRSNRKHARPK